MNENPIAACDLMRRFGMDKHPENGYFVEKHYPNPTDRRAASGSIYYYVAPDEITAFHRIDCDEYWCYTHGDPLEVWSVAEDGTMSVRRLGMETDCEPMLYLPKGCIFASRHTGNCLNGTFLVCITVPRFSYDAFEMFTEEEMFARCPETKAFFKP